MNYSITDIKVVSDNKTKTYWVKGKVLECGILGTRSIEMSGGVSAVSDSLMLFNYVDSEEQVRSDAKGVIIRLVLDEILKLEQSGDIKYKEEL